MEQGPNEKAIIEQATRERKPLPDSMANAPDLWLGSDLYYMAFMDLTSCRSSGQAVPGPIPWSSIQLYCDVHEIEGEQREDVFYHVQHLDKSYLDWSSKRYKKEMAVHAPKPKGLKS